MFPFFRGGGGGGGGLESATGIHGYYNTKYTCTVRFVLHGKDESYRNSLFVQKFSSLNYSCKNMFV